jgi:uncharacterized protein
MGHRHSPQAQCCDGAVHRAHGGADEAAQDSVRQHASVPDSVAATFKWPLNRSSSHPSHETMSQDSRLTTQCVSLTASAALFAIRCYKSYLSVFFAGSCRFEPSCSQYTYEAIERFGVPRGIWLGIKRLSRCHPFSGKFGFDPVPENTWVKSTIEPLHSTYAAALHSTNRIAPMKDGTPL